MRFLSCLSPFLLLPGLLTASEPSPQDLMEKGVEAFLEADITTSLEAFDALVEGLPEVTPRLWQRGLALYYAGRFEDGRKQFETHQTYNTQDVENAAWHFLCVAKLEGVEAAREGLIDITGDRRVPMAEIHDLYAGTGSAEAVLKAAGENRNHLCYAHLYLGLYFEVLDQEDRAREHMLKAAVDHAMDHYMGLTAQVHVKLRGWQDKP